jgi:hypothetical protein
MNPAYISGIRRPGGRDHRRADVSRNLLVHAAGAASKRGSRSQEGQAGGALQRLIAEASRLFVDALTHQTEDPTNMLPLYALVGRMRLVSSRSVIDAAMRIEHHILETYLGPNRSLHETRDPCPPGRDKHPHRIQRGLQRGPGRLRAVSAPKQGSRSS